MFDGCMVLTKCFVGCHEDTGFQGHPLHIAALVVRGTLFREGIMKDNLSRLCFKTRGSCR